MGDYDNLNIIEGSVDFTFAPGFTVTRVTRYGRFQKIYCNFEKWDLAKMEQALRIHIQNCSKRFIKTLIQFFIMKIHIMWSNGSLGRLMLKFTNSQCMKIWQCPTNICLKKIQLNVPGMKVECVTMVTCPKKTSNISHSLLDRFLFGESSFYGQLNMYL